MRFFIAILFVLSTPAFSNEILKTLSVEAKKLCSFVTQQCSILDCRVRKPVHAAVMSRFIQVYTKKSEKLKGQLEEFKITGGIEVLRGDVTNIKSKIAKLEDLANALEEDIWRSFAKTLDDSNRTAKDVLQNEIRELSDNLKKLENQLAESVQQTGLIDNIRESLASLDDLLQKANDTFLDTDKLKIHRMPGMDGPKVYLELVTSHPKFVGIDETLKSSSLSISLKKDPSSHESFGLISLAVESGGSKPSISLHGEVFEKIFRAVKEAPSMRKLEVLNNFLFTPGFLASNNNHDTLGFYLRIPSSSDGFSKVLKVELQGPEKAKYLKGDGSTNYALLVKDILVYALISDDIQLITL